jgi:hypothetical protein
MLVDTPIRQRKVEIYLDGSKVLENYGRLDQPKFKESELRHRSETRRELVKGFSTPFYKATSNQDEIIDLGLTANFTEIFNSYINNYHIKQEVPQAAMDTLNQAAINLINFVEKIISSSKFQSYEDINITINIGKKSAKSFQILRQYREGVPKPGYSGEYTDEFVYTLRPGNLKQELRVKTETNTAKQIKDVAILETESDYEDTFGITFKNNSDKNYYHSLRFHDLDTDTNQVRRRPIPTVARAA